MNSPVTTEMLAHLKMCPVRFTGVTSSPPELRASRGIANLLLFPQSLAQFWVNSKSSKLVRGINA